MAKKFLTLVFLWICIAIYESCCPLVPFFLYKQIEVAVLNSTITADDSLAIQIYPVVTQYVAKAGLTAQSAFAWQCEQGESGPKYQIEEIKIITLEDFDQDHLKGELINDLLMIEYYPYRSHNFFVSPLNLLEDKKNIFRGTVFMHARPTLSTSLSLRIEIKNVRGEVSSIDTSLIIWN